MAPEGPKNSSAALPPFFQTILRWISGTREPSLQQGTSQKQKAPVGTATSPSPAGFVSFCPNTLKASFSVSREGYLVTSTVSATAFIANG